MRVWQMGRAMNQLLLKSFEKKRGAVVLLCEKHGVASLDLFGSGVSGAWNPNTSDLDFIVTFRTDAVGLLIDRYLGLADDLEALFGARVDLVTPGAIRNPYFREAIEVTRSRVYAE